MSLDPHEPIEGELPENAVELLRAWVIDGNLHCQLNIGPADEDAAVVFAILLADVARHVANALQKTQGIPAAGTLAKLQQHFNTELNSATADIKGGGFVC
jgi:hypothetical protein